MLADAVVIPQDFVPLLRTERAKNILRFFLQGVEGSDTLSTSIVSGWVAEAATKFKTKPKSILAPLQIALTGLGDELVLDPVPALLGKEKVNDRLRQALAIAEAPHPEST